MTMCGRLPEISRFRIFPTLRLVLKEVKITEGNKKKLNLRSQDTDKNKNGRIPDEYHLFGVARKYCCLGFQENLAHSLPL